MKKFIKNSSLIIITLLTVLVGLSSASAISCSETDLPCKSTTQGDWIASGTYKSGVSTTMTKTAYHAYLSSFNLALYKNDKPYSAKNYNYYSYSDSFGNTDYCLDADKSSVKSLFIHRFLLDNYLDSKNVYLHDVAIMEVLTSVGQPAPKSAENIATSIAIRTLNHVFGLSQDFERTNKSDSWEAGGVYNKGYMGLAYKWVVGDEYYPEVKSAYDLLSNKLASESFFRPASTLGNFKDWRFTDVNGGTTLQRARELFNAGILAASKAADTNGNAVVESGLTGEILNDGIKKETDAIGERVYLDMKFTFKLKNFTNDGKSEFKIDNLVYNEGAEKVGAISEPKVIYVGDDAGQIICDEMEGSTSGACSGVIGKNILEGMTMVEEKNIFVIIRFEGYSSLKDQNSSTPVLNCGAQPMAWTMNYSYNDSNITNLYPDYVGSVWYGYGDNGQKLNTVQRYVSVTKASGEQEKGKKEELTGEVILKEECDCVSLREACIATGNLKSDECKEFFAAGCSECDELKVECEVGKNQTACKTYEDTCEFTCDTHVDTFECCDADNLIVSTEDDKEVSILGPGPDNPEADNIKACFVNMVDKQKKDESSGYSNVAGVKDQKDNSYTSSDVANNKYCSVSCKEDYVMTMPTAKMVNAGRYFTFKAKIEGTKTCYTNTIDRDQYNKDIIEKQKDLLEKYNTYKKWYELYTNGNISILPGTYPSSCSCNSHGCGPTCQYTTYDKTWLATATVPDWQTLIKEYEETGLIDRSEDPNAVDATMTYKQPINPVTSSSCPGGKWTTHPLNKPPVKHECSGGAGKTYYTGTEIVNTKEDFIEYLRKRMESARADLKSAKEAYEKNIMLFHECTNDAWSSELTYEPEVYYDYQEDYLNKFGLIGEMDDQVISQSTDTEWFCKGKDAVNKDYTSCTGKTSSSRQGSLETMAYIVCDDDTGCIVENRKEYSDISNANYVSKTSDIAVNYIPKTLFYNVYSSGEITDTKADDNVELTNKLPVALNRDRGIYKYTVNVENLGEFYDRPTKGNLGRYVGASTAVVDPDTLVYNCAYLVNIVESNGWVCDFDDNCTDDCISNCQGPNCGEDYCEGADCIHECIGMGCIYDTTAGSSILEKVVSLSKLFPNGTNSYNWNQSRNDKADKTVTEIESLGNNVYDEQPILSVTINGSTGAAIRKHNDEVENQGGYSNSSLDCYALGGNNEIACYSRFITGLMEGDYGNNIINDRSLVKDVRNVGDNNTDYFTLWDGAVSEHKMLGPSWK